MTLTLLAANGGEKIIGGGLGGGAFFYTQVYTTYDPHTELCNVL